MDVYSQNKIHYYFKGIYIAMGWLNGLTKLKGNLFAGKKKTEVDGSNEEKLDRKYGLVSGGSLR
jgi:hypothetical protein